MIYPGVFAQIKKLLARIQKDDVGEPIGSEFVGGNGGLLSIETIQEAGMLRQELNKIERPSHRHRKGGEYRVLGVAKIQSDDWCQMVSNGQEPDSVTGETIKFARTVDMQEVVVYQSTKDDTLWVRPKTEFEDGRFTPL